MKKRMHGNTGCKRLDVAGIKKGQSLAGCQICLHCPELYCVLTRNKPETLIENVEKEEEYKVQEISVVCENCHTMETIEFINGIFGRHPRFSEEAGNIFHLKADGSICGKCNGFKDRGLKQLKGWNLSTPI